MTANTETVKFTDAYETLGKVSNDLKTCSDLDLVADKIKTGLDAYAICMDRVKSVRKMIGELTDDPVPE